LCFGSIVPEIGRCSEVLVFFYFFFAVSDVKETSSAPLHGSLNLLIVQWSWRKYSFEKREIIFWVEIKKGSAMHFPLKINFEINYFATINF
jgi:hypothetical protein